MSQNLEIAKSRLQEAATSVLMETGSAKTDDQQEALSLIQKGISEVEAMIGNYE